MSLCCNLISCQCFVLFSYQIQRSKFVRLSSLKHKLSASQIAAQLVNVTTEQLGLGTEARYQ